MIELDCTFRISRLFGQHVAEPYRWGSLTSEQQAQLSAILDKAAVPELPAQMGETTRVNARRITAEYDGKVSVLSLSPGDSDVDAIRTSGPRDPARRLLEVVDAVKEILGN
jgi:hypothetical protein